MNYENGRYYSSSPEQIINPVRYIHAERDIPRDIECCGTHSEWERRKYMTEV
jgi:hypothetical protein